MPIGRALRSGGVSGVTGLLGLVIIIIFGFLMRQYIGNPNQRRCTIFPCTTVNRLRDNHSSATAALTARPMTIYATSTHVTPGWREAIEIKHLAQGHDVMNHEGVEAAILGSQV